MLNTMIVASVTGFSGTTTPDKNGAAPVMLQCMAGNMPNRNVLSGTVAQRAGFEIGKTYLVNVRESGYDEIFGPDFTYIKIMELTTGLDIVRASKELGEPRITYVQRPEGFEQHYQRKGDAVESYRSKRIREGLYKPTTQTSIADHRTARDVKQGSSVNSGGTFRDEEQFLRNKGANVENLSGIPYDEEGPLFPEPDEIPEIEGQYDQGGDENEEDNDLSNQGGEAGAASSPEEFERQQNLRNQRNPKNNRNNS